MVEENIAAEFIELALRRRSLADFLDQALPILARRCASEQIAIWAGVNGQWKPIASTATVTQHDARLEPQSRSPSISMLAESADSGEPVVDQGQLAYALPHAPWGAAVWVLQPESPETACRVLEQLASVVGRLLRLLDWAAHRERRAQRLAALIQVVSDWNARDAWEPLAQQIADFLTGAFGVDWAVVALWDRQNRQLVLHRPPSDGHEPVRMADNQGIFGRVLATGDPERSSASISLREAADQPTEDDLPGSILCVPLPGTRNRRLGLLAVGNPAAANGGALDFSDSDQQDLCDVALVAARAMESCPKSAAPGGQTGAMEEPPSEGLIGESAQIQQLRAEIQRVARSELTVLVLGENGTGKEVVSREIHRQGNRASHPFIAVNCAALTATLLESELFGHEKGAFTDAHQTRKGKFELARAGTLLLDEIGEMSLSSQAKLLRVLDEQSVVRVGGTESISVNPRVIAATNRDLGVMVREKTFREDLFFRLNVVTLRLPPLRERGQDVLLFAKRFLHAFCHASGRAVPKLTAAAERRLVHHPWHGNVRELRNVMQRVAFLVSEDTVDADALPLGDDADSPPTGLPLAEATRQFQAAYIQNQIQNAGGNMTEAANRLGLHRSNLYRKMSQLGLDAD